MDCELPWVQLELPALSTLPYKPRTGYEHTRRWYLCGDFGETSEVVCRSRVSAHPIEVDQSRIALLRCVSASLSDKSFFYVVLLLFTIGLCEAHSSPIGDE